MTTTTSILHHKPPPLKTRNEINTAVFLRSNNYYGSVGRPSHGRRKSAVELLQESKAFYVKSESVLDTKQELKNADHLQVRSPTMESPHYRGGPPPPSAPPAVGGPSFPYATFTCGGPPYPHEHLDHNSIQLMHSNYLNSIKREGSKRGSKVTAKITLIEASTNFANSQNKSGGENWDAHIKKSSSSKMRRSIQPPGTLHIMGERGKNVTPAVSKNTIGLPLTFTTMSQNGSLYSLEKHSIATANLPVITSVSTSTTGNSLVSHGGIIRERKEESSEADSLSPPPLPPKSPRVTSKPTRPNDFPQRLVQQQQQQSGAPDSMLPPPPPRRVHHDVQSTDVHSNLRRIIHDQHKNGGAEPIIPPMTLPSPILPPTPPIDVVMESPMSDSGPIISPPPAFSTPVTPMLDRQNSSVSDRSNNPYPILQKTPLSAAVSMSGVSSISSRSRKSIPDDVSMRYSPRSRSRSRSSSSPMSHQDIENTNNTTSSTGGKIISSRGGGVGRRANSISSDEDESEEEAISADLEGDDDDSSRVDCKPKRNNSKKSHSSSGVSSRPSPKKSISNPPKASAIIPTSTNLKTSQNQKAMPMPKSVTENFLCRVSHPSPGTGMVEPLMINNNHAAQTLPMVHQPRPRIVSPVRRPILRSKSDLSHRYIKAGIIRQPPGFTLVHVDLGQQPQPPSHNSHNISHSSTPPPIPIHNSISTNDFATLGGGHRNYENYHHHTHHPSNQHIYSRPAIHINSTTAYENFQNGKSDLDRFFDQLGLDNKGPLALLPPPCPLSKLNKDKSGSESPVYFSSVSSVDSGARKSGSGDSEDSPTPLPLGKVIGARTTGGGPGYPTNNISTTATANNNNGPSIVVHHGEPSIVERNARVIKWLFNCRKAFDGR